MLCELDVIVLSKLKYKESDLIVKCYSKQKGVVNFILKGILNSKKSKKTGFFQLLSQLKINTNLKPGRDLHFVKDVKSNVVYLSLHNNIYKSAIVMFLAEVLAIVLREEEQNDTLYQYLETTFQWLDLNTDFANFHLLFLINLTKHLGFYPDISNIEFNNFCLREGEFQYVKTSELSVFGEELELFKQLLGTNFDEVNSIKVNAKQRYALLTSIVKYYELHLHGFKKPKSLQILSDVFN